jgi:hypothetical protein
LVGLVLPVLKGHLDRKVQQDHKAFKDFRVIRDPPVSLDLRARLVRSEVLLVLPARPDLLDLKVLKVSRAYRV